MKSRASGERGKHADKRMHFHLECRLVLLRAAGEIINPGSVQTWRSERQQTQKGRPWQCSFHGLWGWGWSGTPGAHSTENQLPRGLRGVHGVLAPGPDAEGSATVPRRAGNWNRALMA